MTYEAGILEYDDFPRTDAPVFILGTAYSALHELDDISDDIKSRLWFTYRWGFAAIGGEGPTSDQGWGCMLRCGQMMLAQSLINLHLGREWRWNEGKNDQKYYRILKMFQDKRDFTSAYSIHQIANMGASEGKAIGQWFGPNTVAQVLKKLAVYDEWSNIAIHVALDNTVIIEDIRTLCKCSCSECIEQQGNESKVVQSSSNSIEKLKSHFKDNPNEMIKSIEEQFEGGRKLSILDRVKANNFHAAAHISADSPSVLSCDSCESCSLAGLNSCSCQSKPLKHWKPVLVVIPLRLGLTEINSVYVTSLKVCFKLKQSVGIIGGRPNQAHWFIGTVDDELIFLDPHTCQPYEDFTQSGCSDESYHCPYKCRMDIAELDPSIALGFFCATEKDFDDMCLSFHKFLICGTKTPLFEIHERRPKHWPAFEPYTSPLQASSPEFEQVESQYDSDEEFVML